MQDLAGIVAAANHVCQRLLLWCGTEPQMDEVPTTAPVLTPERIANVLTTAFQRLGGSKAWCARSIPSLPTPPARTASACTKSLSEAQRRACESGEPVPDETALPDA